MDGTLCLQYPSLGRIFQRDIIAVYDLLSTCNYGVNRAGLPICPAILELFHIRYCHSLIELPVNNNTK